MNVTFVSDGSLEQQIKEIVQRIQRPNPVNIDVISDTMRAIVRENFESESGDGQPWTQLARQTVEEREQQGYPGEHPILIRSGDLFESATNPNDPDHVERVEGNLAGFSVLIGTNDPRATRLNNGGGRIPARPFMTADGEQTDILATAIEAYFDALFV